METRLSLLLALFMVLLLLRAVDFTLSDSQVDLPKPSGKDPNFNDQTGGSSEKGSELKSKPVADSGPVKNRSTKQGEQVTEPKDTKDNDSSGESGDSEEKTANKGGDGSNTAGGSQVKSGDNKEGKSSGDNKEGQSSGESGNDGQTKKTGGGEVGDPLPNKGKKDPHVEECDPSYKCTDDKIKLAACLRAPGESMDYSLLIQNTGKGTLNITISAPECIHLEETNVLLEGKHDKTMKVSMGEGKREDLIILKASTGICELNISDLITNQFGKDLDSRKTVSSLNFIMRTPIVAAALLAALLIVASAWTCIMYRKKQLSGNGSKYQRLEMEIPVSGGEKAGKEVNDGWDDNWGDDWDDEEAPKTPSMPVTPSVSAKGLASRRLSKDGWKD